MYDNLEKNPICILVSVDTGDYDVDYSLFELEQLSKTASLDVFCYVTQKRKSYDKSTFIGKGKLEEILSIIEENQIDLVIFDNELSATQIKNIENLIGIRVIDRTMLILDIFALNAKSKEGIIQIKLAQNKYRLSRLSGIGVDLDRQGGVGGRGPGEKKLELDRRKIKDEINSLKKELEELSLRREIFRKKRKDNNIITVVILGYTNSGKSTLMNCLTNANILAEDKLFATLDPTSRVYTLTNGREVMFVDTVGFISRLPHNLVESFKSTLEEVKYADVILHLIDCADPNFKEQITVTDHIISQLECSAIPIIKVYNKCDICLTDVEFIKEDISVKISAKNSDGIDNLIIVIEDILNKDDFNCVLSIPYSDISVINTIRNYGVVNSEVYLDNIVEVDCLITRRLVYLVDKYTNNK
ncbi:MAG: GTPase HflX [Oscillospiraceae bacterium]|nr:GTPase HflX [Oscillospiraceae bacterium]